jgi:hypothetical protein
MQVGFVTSILWSRYGAFWRGLAAEAGAEIRFAAPDRVLQLQRSASLPAVPSVAFRLATAEAVALQDCDLLIVPQPNAGAVSTRGGGQDPWISDFPSVLAATSGLLNVQGVPAGLSASVEPLAIELLQHLTHDGGRVRRLWDRHKARLQPVSLPQPPVTRPGTVAVLAQPWLLNSELIALAAGDAEKVISQLQLDPAQLRAEGERLVPGLLPTDSEVLGAAHWFSRRGGVDRLIFIVDAGSGVDSWLAVQLEKLVNKPLQVVTAQELLPGNELAAGLLLAALQAAAR